MTLEVFNTSFLRFFAASIGLHLMMFVVFYLTPSIKFREPETIPVSILEAPAREAEPVTRIPKRVASRRPIPPAVIAKKNSLPLTPNGETKMDDKKSPNEIIGRADPTPPVPFIETAPPPRETIPEQNVIAERALPSVKELLPPINWSSGSHANAPVSLNSRDPIYVTYFTKIKQLIESHWEYPELALRYGLQGRLSLEFTIGANGQLERLRVVRSSGSQLLDDEAVRAIRAAAPFPPIPPWVKPIPLSISAAMEYHDNRVNYQFVR
jgi:protein TonB